MLDRNTKVLFRLLQAELRAMEGRIMTAMSDKLKAAEDRLGTDIANAIATNKANVQAIADAKSNGDDDTLQSAIDTATSHAEQLEAAFGGGATGDNSGGATGQGAGATGA